MGGEPMAAADWARGLRLTGSERWSGAGDCDPAATRRARGHHPRARARAFAHETLDAVSSAESLGPRDAAFATRLAYGTIACRGTLDEAVARFVSPGRASNRASATRLRARRPTRSSSRSTPARAAVSEGVELVRSVRPKAAGLANAVLQAPRRVRSGLSRGAIPPTDVAALARSHGHPQWLAELWIDETRARRQPQSHGREQRACAAVPGDTCRSRASPATAFAAPDRGDGAEPISTARCLDASSADVPSAAVRSSRCGDAAGRGRRCRRAARRARRRPRARTRIVVELGAGRGTKTFIMARMAQRRRDGTAEITAVDTHTIQARRARTPQRRLGVAQASRTVVATRPTGLHRGAAAAGPVDAVLVDAPCSGLGTLRRHPDRRWRATPERDRDARARSASELLDGRGSLVKPGGFVVYSTCTIARRENAEVVEAFLGV